MTEEEMRQHEYQAGDMAQAIKKLLVDYHERQEQAGHPVLLNDMLSALAHVTGSLLANIPDDSFDQLYGEIGRMVLLSCTMHKLTAHGPGIAVLRPGQPAELIRPGGKKEAVQ